MHKWIIKQFLWLLWMFFKIVIKNHIKYINNYLLLSFSPSILLYEVRTSKMLHFYLRYKLVLSLNAGVSNTSRHIIQAWWIKDWYILMCTTTANTGGSSFICILDIPNNYWSTENKKDTVLKKMNNNIRQKILPGDKKEVNW